MVAEAQRVSGEHAPEGLAVVAPPVPRELLPFVRSWTGYAERTQGVCRRKEMPAPQFVMILEFGPPLAVFESGSEVQYARYAGGFIAGLGDQFTLTQHDGFQTGIQVNLTPLGARSLLQRPLHELSRAVVSLPELVPAQKLLVERLADAGSWSARFRIVDELMRARLANAAAPNAAVRWATTRIEQSGGAVEVNELASELGYSRKHLASLFHEHVGLPPKLFASLVRFDRLLERLRSGAPPRWSELAFEFGYADQSHLVREVRRFSSMTPTQIHSSLLSPAASEPEPCK